MGMQQPAMVFFRPACSISQMPSAKEGGTKSTATIASATNLIRRFIPNKDEYRPKQ